MTTPESQQTEREADKLIEELEYAVIARVSLGGGAERVHAAKQAIRASLASAQPADGSATQAHWKELNAAHDIADEAWEAIADAVLRRTGEH